MIIKKIIIRAMYAWDNVVGMRLRQIIFRKSHIKGKKVFFMTYDSSFSCNPSYIAKKLMEEHPEVELIWTIPGKGTVDYSAYPKELKLVRRGSFAMFRAMNQSKVWIDNALNCVWFNMPKDKDQYYINTWHGSLGIKKLGGNADWMRRAQRCKDRTDFCISNSTFEENVYRETFWPNTPYLRYGHPRNDLLFQVEEQKELREKVCESLGIDKTKKLFLYAPTFRDDGDVSCYDLDFSMVKNSLEKRFGGEWVVLVRYHHKNKLESNALTYNEWLVNASMYPDMQEMLSVVDAGCSDYSSWVYDYLLTRRPTFLYATDLAKYDGSRGFYYSLYDTPFPIAKSNEEMEQAIQSFDEQTYRANCERFLEEKGCMEDGHASERVVEKIVALLEM